MNRILTLHSYRRCPFAIRVRMTLEEKNIQYEVIEENLNAFSKQLLDLHPEGVVPLLLHDGQAIYESSIITEYLDEAFPGKPLMPKTPSDRAQVRLWTYWCNRIFKPDLDLAKYEWSDLDPQNKAALKIRIYGYLEKLETALKASSYLVGTEFSLADIHVFPFLRQLVRVKGTDLDLSSYFKAHQWLKGIEERPCFDRAMSKRTKLTGRY